MAADYEPDPDSMTLWYECHAAKDAHRKLHGRGDWVRRDYIVAALAAVALFVVAGSCCGVAL